MPDHQFQTHRPVDLYVEIGKGSVEIRCAETTESTAEVTGQHADDVVVEQEGDQIRITEPRRGGRLFRDTSLQVEVVVPTGSDLTVRTGSADITVTGAAGDTQVRSGSGDVSLDRLDGRLHAETGSGDIRVAQTRGETRLKSGSGDVILGGAGADLSVSTGSGDIQVDTVTAPTAVKTGSGDVRVRESRADLSLTSGSGDLVVDLAHRGLIDAKGASGDVRVAIPTGVPTWTDLLTISGTVRADLESAGEPAPDQDHVEVRAKTVSGDITLSNA